MAPNGSGKPSTVSNETERKLRVFLAHAKADKDIMREFHSLLWLDGFEPWLDVVNLVGGQDWRREIEMAVRTSHAVAVFLSRNSVDHRGFVQKEIALALDAAGYEPEGGIFVLPIRLDDAPVPNSLEHLHWIEALDDAGLIGGKYVGLQKALTRRAEQLGMAVLSRRADVPYSVKSVAAAALRGAMREAMQIAWTWSGLYLVRGRNPNGETYAGMATLELKDERLQLEARIGGQLLTYAGEFNGDRMRFEGTHRVEYKYRPDAGTWAGRWDNDCIEELIPAGPFASTALIQQRIHDEQ